MQLPGKQLIAKAVFAVAVVATTATVGVVSFAQAAPPVAQQNGYGGAIDQLLEAINQYRQAILAATSDYRHDVDVCLGGPAPLSSAAVPSAAESFQLKAAKDNFNHKLDKTVGKLNEKMGDARSAQDGPVAFDHKHKATTGEVFNELTSAQDELAANMGAGNKAKVQQGGLFDCLDDARDKYRRALNDARADLIAAIRRILG